MSIGPHEERWAEIERPKEFDGTGRCRGADAVLKAGFEQALVVVDAAEASGILALDWFERAATECALAGIPIEAVHAVVSDGVAAALQHPGSVRASTPMDLDTEVVADAAFEPDTLSGFLGLLSSAVSRAYAGAVR